MCDFHLSEVGYYFLSILNKLNKAVYVIIFFLIPLEQLFLVLMALKGISYWLTFIYQKTSIFICMQKQFPKINTFTSLVKKITSGIVIGTALQVSNTVAVSNFAPIGDALPGLFITSVAHFFTCFSRTSSRVFEKKPSPFACIVLSLTNIDCSLLLLRQLPINNFSLVLVISLSILHVPL